MPQFDDRKRDTPLGSRNGLADLRSPNITAPGTEEQRLVEILEGWRPVVGPATQAAVREIRARAAEYVSQRTQTEDGKTGADLSSLLARLLGVAGHGRGND